MSDKSLVKLPLKNFLATVEGAVGSYMFRHLYVRNTDSGEELDVLQEGKLSCAYVVSSLLALHNLIDRPHATVATTLNKMAEYGWKETDRPQSGCVAYWPEYEGNAHIGIAIDSKIYVSNSSDERTPITHGLLLKNDVKATKYYIHPTLTSEK